MHSRKRSQSAEELALAHIEAFERSERDHEQHSETQILKHIRGEKKTESKEQANVLVVGYGDTNGKQLKGMDIRLKSVLTALKQKVRPESIVTFSFLGSSSEREGGRQLADVLKSGLFSFAVVHFWCWDNDICKKFHDFVFEILAAGIQKVIILTDDIQWLRACYSDNVCNTTQFMKASEMTHVDSCFMSNNRECRNDNSTFGSSATDCERLYPLGSNECELCEMRHLEYAVYKAAHLIGELSLMH